MSLDTLSADASSVVASFLQAKDLVNTLIILFTTTTSLRSDPYMYYMMYQVSLHRVSPRTKNGISQT